jgi:hypothetical protein
MDRQPFTSLFKDLISRLYDRIAVETHPLSPYFPVAEDSSTRRAEVIQHIIQDEIERLQPEGKEIIIQSPEWRPYLILYQRYIEGQDPRAIATSLYVGDRQFRRDHSRALQALSLRVWQRYFQPVAQPSGGEATDLFEDQGTFELHAEQLDLNEVIRGVINLIGRRLQIENVQLELALSPSPLQVFTDRILLRQILLSLLNYVLHLRGMLARLQPKEEVLLLGWGVPMPLPVKSRRYDDNFWRELFGAGSKKNEAQIMKELGY